MKITVENAPLASIVGITFSCEGLRYQSAVIVYALQPDSDNALQKKGRQQKRQRNQTNLLFVENEAASLRIHGDSMPPKC